MISYQTPEIGYAYHEPLLKIVQAVYHVMINISIDRERTIVGLDVVRLQQQLFFDIMIVIQNQISSLV